MKNNKTSNFFLIIVASILGSALFKQFDFENLKFEKTALSILYLIVFAASIFLLVKNFKNRTKK